MISRVGNAGNLHMVRQDERADAAPPVSFREAMRHLPGGVSVITVGRGDNRTGLAATSVSSLSLDPPTVLVSINRSSSSFPVLLESRSFGVNVLSAAHRDVADRFAGRNGEQGAKRYEGARWVTLRTGTSLLEDAVVALDCEVEEIIERHSHAIVIGRVQALRLNGGPSALVYWRGEYDQLGWTQEEISRAVGLVPVRV
jgi:flavin reductase (DIM6/NTAB) family NADH-FMN oxidoreductase RutF